MQAFPEAVRVSFWVSLAQSSGLDSICRRWHLELAEQFCYGKDLFKKGGSGSNEEADSSARLWERSRQPSRLAVRHLTAASEQRTGLPICQSENKSGKYALQAVS